MQHMFKYFISLAFVFVVCKIQAQEQVKDSIAPKVNQKTDSISYKTAYGLRIGIDISKPILGELNERYSGLEFVADYRIGKSLYIATEFGFEEETANEDFTNSTVNGNYARIGLNYNQFKNWLDMNNELLIGFRYGYSTFKQTLNSYTPNVTDATNGIYFPLGRVETNETAEGLSAHWGEMLIGFKVEVFTNTFISVSGSYKIMLDINEPEDFKALYAPGFNRIFESNTGFGFNYTISYLIPFKKK